MLCRSDESAWTIVQSRPSTVVESARSRKSVESTDLIYQRLSFEDDLFTARVYKRNYIGLMISGRALTQVKGHSRVKEVSKGQQVTHDHGQDSQTEILSDSIAPQPAESTYDGSSILRSDNDSEAEDDAATILSASVEGGQVSSVRRVDTDLNPMFSHAARSYGSSSLSGNRTDTWALNLAANQGRINVLAKLLQPSNMQDTFYWRTQSYFDACAKGDLSLVRLLMTKGMTVDSRDAEGRWGSRSSTGIHVAVLHNHIRIVKFLLDHGALIDAKNHHDDRPIHLSSRQSLLDMTSFLLREGATVGAYNKDGRQPIHLAARAGSTELVERLLEGGAALDAVDKDGRQPIHLAAAGGWTSTVNVLLEAGAAFECHDHSGKQPIHLAARAGSTELVERLLEGGAALDAVDKDGRQPIHLAAAGGWTSTVNVLLEAGAAFECHDHSGKQPIHLAARAGSTELVERLLEGGAALDAVDKDGRQPIHLAAAGGWTSTVNVLLEAGAALECCDYSSQQPIHHASKGGFEAAVLALWKAGASINARNHAGKQPLHIAAEAGSLGVTTLLLDAGASLYSRDLLGRQPIFYAVEGRSDKIITALLKAGASLAMLFDDPIFSSYMGLKKRSVRFTAHQRVFNALSETAGSMEIPGTYWNSVETKLWSKAPEMQLALIKLSASVGGKYSSLSRQPMFLAAEAGCVELVSIFLDGGASVHTRDDSGLQLIHVATIKDFPELVSVLLKAGASAVALYGPGQQAIIDATQNCSYKVLDLLINAGASVHCSNESGMQLIHLATLAQSTECILYLVSKGAKLEALTDDDHQYTPLQLACSRGLNLSVQALLSLGAPSYIKGLWSRTPLELATLGRHADVMTTLLETESLSYAPASLMWGRVLARLVHGDYGKERAIKLCQADVLCLKILLEHNQDVNCTYNGCQVLGHFVSSPLEWNEWAFEIVKLLISHGYNPNAVNCLGYRIIHQIAAADWHPGFTAVMDLLLTCGADINATDGSGRTPLCIAAKSVKSKQVEWLIANGATGLSAPEIDRIRRNYRNLARVEKQRAASRILELLEEHGSSERTETMSRKEDIVVRTCQRRTGRPDPVILRLSGGITSRNLDLSSLDSAWGLSWV